MKKGICGFCYKKRELSVNIVIGNRALLLLYKSKRLCLWYDDLNCVVPFASLHVVYS